MSVVALTAQPLSLSLPPCTRSVFSTAADRSPSQPALTPLNLSHIPVRVVPQLVEVPKKPSVADILADFTASEIAYVNAGLAC